MRGVREEVWESAVGWVWRRLMRGLRKASRDSSRKVWERTHKWARRRDLKEAPRGFWGTLWKGVQRRARGWSEGGPEGGLRDALKGGPKEGPNGGSRKGSKGRSERTQERIWIKPHEGEWGRSQDGFKGGHKKRSVEALKRGSKEGSKWGSEREFEGMTVRGPKEVLKWVFFHLVLFANVM